MFVLKNKKVKGMSAVKVSEKLSDEKMRDLFGVKYQSLLYYNFDTKKWNTNEFLGKGMLGINSNAMYAEKLKSDIEMMPEFKGREIAALVFMPIASEKYPGFGSLVYNPSFCVRKYSFNGYALVATLVLRNSETGKILPTSNVWAKANKARTRYILVQSSVQKFVKKVSENGSLKRSLVAVNTL